MKRKTIINEIVKISQCDLSRIQDNYQIIKRQTK